MDKLTAAPPAPEFKIVSCVYCKRESNHRICIYCDGKRTARNIHRHVEYERNIAIGRNRVQYFNEEKMKEFLIDRDIKGLEGLGDGERQVFWKAFNAEYSKLRGSSGKNE